MTPPRHAADNAAPADPRTPADAASPALAAPGRRRLTRRSLGLVAAAALTATSPALLAQSGSGAAPFPQRPITLVVPFAPGGATDVIARDLAQQLAAALKQTVLVDNRPGAGTTIGTAHVAKSPADGHTLLFAPTPFAISQVMYPKLPYDPAKDFVPVTLLATSPFVLVAHPSLPAGSIAELIALAKAKPGSLSFGSAGNGTVPHLAGELFKMRTGTELVHVPYKGGGPAIIDLVSGQIQLLFSPPVEIAQQISAGRVKVLATTAQQRLASYPDAPTLLESGVRDYDVRSWFGVLAPAGTPAAALDILAKGFATAVESPDIRRRFDEQGIQIQVEPGAAFGRFIDANVTLWRDIAKASGAKID